MEGKAVQPAPSKEARGRYGATAVGRSGGQAVRRSGGRTLRGHCEGAKRPKQSSGLREHAAGLPRALRALAMTTVRLTGRPPDRPSPPHRQAAESTIHLPVLRHVNRGDVVAQAAQ